MLSDSEYELSVLGVLFDYNHPGKTPGRNEIERFGHSVRRKVEDILVSDSYTPADERGIRTSDRFGRPDAFQVGILEDRKKIFGLLKRRAWWVGSLYFNKYHAKATGISIVNPRFIQAHKDEDIRDESYYWILKVHGEENFSKMKTLSDKLSSSFEVEVTTEIGSNSPKKEAYKSDGMAYY